jgi:hypothetical protein
MLVIQANIPCIAPQELSVAVNKDQAFSEQPFFGAFKRNEEVLIEVQIKRLFDDIDSDRASPPYSHFFFFVCERESREVKTRDIDSDRASPPLTLSLFFFSREVKTPDIDSDRASHLPTPYSLSFCVCVKERVGRLRRVA